MAPTPAFVRGIRGGALHRVKSDLEVPFWPSRPRRTAISAWRGGTHATDGATSFGAETAIWAARRKTIPTLPDLPRSSDAQQRRSAHSARARLAIIGQRRPCGPPKAIDVDGPSWAFNVTPPCVWVRTGTPTGYAALLARQPTGLRISWSKCRLP